ncbi:MAG TPA: cysteine dioxygenase family protein [Dermatophilaceae bacterium]|nr:cysteine dioxygenase family protein [Dermatophilaceae bacterium]
MTLAPAHTLGSAGIDRFSPAQLLRTARLFASDPELTTLIDHQSGERRWVELDSSPYLQIWLLSWPAGSGTGWHDHGESAGAFLTVSGTLVEQTAHGHRQIRRTLTGGQGRAFPPNHLHDVVNAGLETAFSVHLYAPRLTSMTRYAVTPAGLRATGVDRVGLNW